MTNRSKSPYPSWRQRMKQPDLVAVTNSANADRIFRLLTNMTSLPKRDVKRVVVLLQHSDDMVKIAAINLLARSRHRETMKDIWKIRSKRNPLVRAAIAEASGDLADKVHKKELHALLSDPNELVRSYAARSVTALFGRRVAKVLKSRLRPETHASTRATLLACLYSIGEETPFDELLTFINSRSYRTRCTVINLVLFYCRKKDRARAIDAFESRLKIEKARGVRGNLKHAISILQAKRGK